MITRRIFVTGPDEATLDPVQASIYQAILGLVEANKYEAQRFMISGLPATMGWSFNQVDEVMRRCVGSLVVAFPRWNGTPPWDPTTLPEPVSGEFYNYEGAVAKTLGIPTLIVTTQGISNRGIVYTGGGQVICAAPKNANVSWVSTGIFKAQFGHWLTELQKRRDVFLAYSSGAQATANAINLFLMGLGVKVFDWKQFSGGGNILNSIKDAAGQCTGGIFLFTEDDMMDSQLGDQAAPRDNVVFEAGYFTQAKGPERTLIIREKMTKMPADVAGSIYLPLINRHDITPIHEELRKFVEERL